MWIPSLTHTGGMGRIPGMFLSVGRCRSAGHDPVAGLREPDQRNDGNEDHGRYPEDVIQAEHDGLRVQAALEVGNGLLMREPEG